MKQNLERILRIFYEDDLKRYQRGVKIPTVLKLLKSDYLNRAVLRELIIKRCELAHFFEDQLRYIIEIIKKSDISINLRPKFLKAVEQNLDEELGKISEYGNRAHKDDRAIFLNALGVDYTIWSSALGNYDGLGQVHLATKFIISAVRPLIALGPIAALTVLWYWEHRLSRGGEGEFFIFLRAFEKKFPEFKKDSYQEGDVLWWLSSHADHDTYHAQLAADALKSIETDNNLVQWILRTMDNYFEIYWYLLDQRS